MNADVAAAIPYEGKKVLAKGIANLNLPAYKLTLGPYCCKSLTIDVVYPVTKNGTVV